MIPFQSLNFLWIIYPFKGLSATDKIPEHSLKNDRFLCRYHDDWQESLHFMREKVPIEFTDCMFDGRELTGHILAKITQHENESKWPERQNIWLYQLHEVAIIWLHYKQKTAANRTNAPYKECQYFDLIYDYKIRGKPIDMQNDKKIWNIPQELM